MFNLKRGSAKRAEPAGETVTARLNARVQPIDRGEYFEHPLEETLKEEKLGEVTGGGTQLTDEPAGIAYCDLELQLTDVSSAALVKVVERLEALGAPKGSKLIVESNGREIPFGKLEGLAVYLNGSDLPEEVYASCDVNHVIEELNRLMGPKGSFRGYWEGSKDTGLYCYGPSFAEMRKAIEPLLSSYPLCQKAKVEQIA